MNVVKENGMNQDHVTLTILDVSRRIVGMQDLLKALYELQGWQNQQLVGGARAPEPKLPPPQAVRPRTADHGLIRDHGTTGPRDHGTRAARRATPGTSEAVLKQLEVIRGLDQPFQAKSFKEAAAMGKAGASSALCRFVGRGWLRKGEKFGFYERTGKFPPREQERQETKGPKDPWAKPALTRDERAKPSLTRDEIRKQLENACKQRDQARMAGREMIVEVFQKDIDRLEGMLEIEDSR